MWQPGKINLGQFSLQWGHRLSAMETRVTCAASVPPGQAFNGGHRLSAMETLDRRPGPGPIAAPGPPAAYARRLWRESEPIAYAPGHPARRWLTHRCLWWPDLPLPRAVRWLAAPGRWPQHAGAGAIVRLLAPGPTTGLIRPPCADLESRRRRDAPARFPSQGCPGRGPRSFPCAGASATGQGPAIPSSAGQVGVGAEAIRPAPPESGPAGVVEASRTRRTGATRPKPGGSTVCGGIHSE